MITPREQIQFLKSWDLCLFPVLSKNNVKYTGLTLTLPDRVLGSLNVLSSRSARIGVSEQETLPGFFRLVFHNEDIFMVRGEM
jgi:hypothetical protein